MQSDKFQSFVLRDRKRFPNGINQMSPNASWREGMASNFSVLMRYPNSVRTAIPRSAPACASWSLVHTVGAGLQNSPTCLSSMNREEGGTNVMNIGGDHGLKSLLSFHPWKSIFRTSHQPPHWAPTKVWLSSDKRKWSKPNLSSSFMCEDVEDW